MARFDVFVTRRIPHSAFDLLSQRCNLDVWDSDGVIPRDVLLDKVRNKSGLFCLLTDNIDKDVFEEAGSKLKVVSTMSVGVDHIDVGECRGRGIKLGYTPNILTSATAELTVGLLLATCRRIVEGSLAVKNGLWGNWKPMWMCGPTLDGSTVGFFGLGRIGEAVLQRLRPFGVKKFLFNTLNKKSRQFEEDVGGKWANFNQLLIESDFVISCCSLTLATREVFNMAAFEKMKRSAIFINIARGAVVRQDDLVEALQSHVIRGAGIDVTTPEPLPTDHPLLQLNNLVVTPHIGSATEKTRTMMAELAAQNLLHGLRGETMPAPYPL